jgi:hypothetical protein
MPAGAGLRLPGTLTFGIPTVGESAFAELSFAATAPVFGRVTFAAESVFGPSPEGVGCGHTLSVAYNSAMVRAAR